jgi:hypothetical protein
MITNTWEQAAEEAASTIAVIPPIPTMAALERIDCWLSHVRDDAGDPLVHLRWIGEVALSLYAETTITGPADALDEVVSTIISKQHDYGHDNIAWGGLQGLVLRMHDKLARIENLLARYPQAAGRGDDAKNESLNDSWLDLVGYSIIGIMWENDTFMLPLEVDHEDYEPALGDFATVEDERFDSAQEVIDACEEAGVGQVAFLRCNFGGNPEEKLRELIAEVFEDLAYGDGEFGPKDEDRIRNLARGVACELIANHNQHKHWNF